MHKSPTFMAKIEISTIDPIWFFLAKGNFLNMKLGVGVSTLNLNVFERGYP